MEPGTPIRCEMTKWGDRPHWRFEGIYLGADEHGEWLGFPRCTHNTRPGFEFNSDVDAVTLVPTGGWYAATFHAPGIWCAIYIDITTPGRWDGDVLRAVDLDLDVIKMSPEHLSDPLEWMAGPGETFVNDEDEFAEHRVAYNYPEGVVTAAQASCDELKAAVRAGVAPYDGTHQRWLDELTRLSAS